MAVKRKMRDSYSGGKCSVSVSMSLPWLRYSTVVTQHVAIEGNHNKTSQH